jgi:hypothetical protein
MDLKVSILSEPPISGSIKEYWFDAKGDCTWIQFERASETWAGVFGKGALKNYNAICKFSDDKYVFIIAGGQGYILDSRAHKLCHKTSIDYFVSAIATPYKDLMIVCDFTSLYAFDTQELIWRSDRIALDGIKLDSSTENELSGKVWQVDGWYSFQLEYKNWKYTQGSRLPKIGSNILNEHSRQNR